MHGSIPASTEIGKLAVNPVHVIDLSFVLPAMIIAGILYYKQKPLGLLLAAPWLTFSVLMGTSIIILLILDMQNGNSDTAVPIAMVSTIVMASLIVLVRFLMRMPSLS